VLHYEPMDQQGRRRKQRFREGTIFFNVSQIKLLTMSVLTSGLYLFFWFYRNWLYVDEHGGRKAWPDIRAAFNPFTYGSLIEEVKKAANIQGYPADLKALWLGTLYLAVVLVGPDLVSMLSIEFGSSIPTPHDPVTRKVMAFLGSLVLPLAATILILPTQRVINAMNEEKSLPTNNRFSVTDLGLIVLCLPAMLGVALLLR
jgi:hypothetical protein